jgi:hypothetical protein
MLSGPILLFIINLIFPDDFVALKCYKLLTGKNFIQCLRGTCRRHSLNSSIALLFYFVVVKRIVYLYESRFRDFPINEREGDDGSQVLYLPTYFSILNSLFKKRKDLRQVTAAFASCDNFPCTAFIISGGIVYFI